MIAHDSQMKCVSVLIK